MGVDIGKKTPLEDFHDYYDVADNSEYAVWAWAAEYVQDSRVELITAEFADIKQAKRDLRAVLYILETELQ